LSEAGTLSKKGFSRCERFAPFAAPTAEHFASACRFHAVAKSVGLFSAAFAGLVGSFHCPSSWVLENNYTEEGTKGSRKKLEVLTEIIIYK